MLSVFLCLPVASIRHNVYIHVNSYQYKTRNASSVLTTTSYSGKITADVTDCNVVGVQFYPEKSGGSGLTFCKNFLHRHF
ncbi:MAG: hypothetical protein ACKESB_01740 [Candidatus Hodgkinia cicadicola]